MNINEIFDEIVGKRTGKFNGIVASVLSVDLVKKTCDVQTLEGAKVFDCRLQAATGSAFFIKPIIGSYVIIHTISENDYYVAMFSQFDEIDLGDGSFSGLVKADVLKTELDKTNKVLNDIVSAVTAVTIVPGDGGAAIKAAIIASIGSDVTGNFSAIKNPKINHGV